MTQTALSAYASDTKFFNIFNFYVKINIVDSFAWRSICSHDFGILKGSFGGSTTGFFSLTHDLLQSV